MMKSFLVILLLTIPIFALSQPSHGEEAYKNFIRKFYYHLTEDDTVTVREATILFGMGALEDESYLFNAICDNNPNQAICKERGIYGHEWGDFASIFFSELKTNKNRFTQGYNEKMDSIIECCAEIYDEGSSGTIAIDIYFPDGKTVYFLMNRYPDEPIYIENIYFEDGIYAFSLYDTKYITNTQEEIDTSTKYLKRLAIINDPDGYTNVRKGKGSEYPIVGKIAADEVFIFTPNYNMKWWKVRNKDDSIEGYMHKSRIVPFGNLPEKKKKELMNKIK